MEDYVREFVIYQLFMRDIILNANEIDKLVDWFSRWFDDQYDAISDAIYYATKDCDIDVEVN